MFVFGLQRPTRELDGRKRSNGYRWMCSLEVIGLLGFGGLLVTCNMARHCKEWGGQRMTDTPTDMGEGEGPHARWYMRHGETDGYLAVHLEMRNPTITA